MANERLNTTATVDLNINGSQAAKVLDDLRTKAEKAREQMDKFAAAGDSKKAEKFRKEMERHNRAIRKLQDSATNVNETLAMLDKASLKDLKASLKTLTRQMNGMERGTEEWARQADKIRRVREQIDSVNRALRTQEETAGGVMDTLKQWQTALMGVFAVVMGYITRLKAFSREVVTEFASMDQEMANVRKYTGMTGEEVKSLNKAFRQMDTRTSREELNKLAQEAGRLGKQSEEDVLGFVRAADKINVALDDLGDGATLTLSKLTGIFGDEKRLGTERALLSVGSVINELSQNCSASAPYLAEFASRMGGVGAQAGMTVQQIMAFGAVLDTTGTNVEASATALQQTIVRIMREPAKYAKVAGLEVKKFTDLVRTDINAALIELLDKLKSAGGMDVLAPMFADMGENGSNAIKVLASLANHIGEVREQQEVANRAFAEATSIDTEFAVQNGTREASLDKRKKRIAELRVELGEKLQPVMRASLASAELGLKVMNAVAGFLIENKTLILSLVAAIGVYTVSIKGATVATKAWNLACLAGNAAVKAGKVLMLAFHLVYLKLTGQIQKAAAAQRLFNMTTKASPMGLLITLLTVVAGALINYAIRAKEAAKATSDLARAEKEAQEAVAGELKVIDQLYSKTEDQNLAMDQRLKAINALREKYPDYFKDISNEAILAGQAADAYRRLKTEILSAAKARGMESMIEELERQKQELQDEYDEKRRPWVELSLERRFKTDDPSKLASDPDYRLAEWNQKVLEKKYQPQISSLEERQNNLVEQVAQYKINSAPTKETDDDDDDDSTGSTSTPYVSSKQAEKERKKAEAAARRAAIKARKEFKEELNNAKGDWEKGDAQNIAERTQGLKSWTEFLTDKHRLQEKLYDDQLAIFRKHNLEEDEDYQELLKKKEQLNADWMKRRQAMAVDDAKLAQKAEEVQAQIDFSTPGSAIFQNEEVLQIRLHDIKVKYLAKMRDAYHKDSEEYYRYQLQLTETEEQNKLEIRKKFAALYVKYSKEYAAKSAKEQLKIQIAMLTTLQQMGVMSMKDYLEAVKKLREEFLNGDSGSSDENNKNVQESAAKKRDTKLSDLERNKDLMSEKEYLKQKKYINSEYQKAMLENARKYQNEYSKMVFDIVETFSAFDKDSAFFDENSNIFLRIGDAAQAAFAVMSSAMQLYSEYSKAELDAQVAKIEKRYEAEAALAEGNVYKQKAAEKKKNKEIAKAKNEANRKQFAMSVIQAVAQTAMNAISAYGAGLKVGGPAGLVLAPIAAAMAIAAGMIQIASIKKQQQASESTGYRQGGFTPKGRPDEPVGVVHAGEWVAPQEIVNNPRTRPIVNLLENVRRSNRMPSISPADVSATVTAPVVAARSGAPVVNVSAPAAPAPSPADPALASAVSRLNDRLDEPFVTVNTVTGDHGIKQAQDEYDRLIRNKSRKK